MTTKVYFIGGPLDLTCKVIEGELPDPYYVPIKAGLGSGNSHLPDGPINTSYIEGIYRRIFELPFSRHLLYEYAGQNR